MKVYNVCVNDFSGNLYSTVVEADDELTAKAFGMDDIHETNRTADLNMYTVEAIEVK